MSDRTRIKICGLRDAETARAAVEAGADAIGVVFVPQSPRYVSGDSARAIAEAVSADATVVGVFKDETREQIHSLATHIPLDELQLHGDHDPTEFAEAYVVKALPFDPATFVEELARWTTIATRQSNMQALLIDTPDPTKLGGGTGHTFDWGQLRRILDTADLVPPIILAGGLTPENVGEAISTIEPWGVDVSSGVESSRGVKDADRIRAFCDAVLGA